MLSKLFDKYTDFVDSSSVSYKMRSKRFAKFLDVLNVSGEDQILDIGGMRDIWVGSGLEKNVTILNISVKENYIDKHGITYRKGDGCNMDMYDDNSFDIAFSNSVIEHVGDFNKQKEFAGEVTRVADKYWVQTPNKHFPVEPHFLFPFFQYFSADVKEFIALRWKYSHYNMLNLSDEHLLEELANIRLLTKTEMRKLFRDSTIFMEKFFGFSKSIIAWKK